MTFQKEMYGNLRPLTVGFDEVFNRLEQLKTLNSHHTFPPYNIVQIDNQNFSIELAIAGYTKESITITREDGSLLISGNLDTGEDDVKYLHKGISGRNFKRSFAIAEDVEVGGATFENGILSISLKRIIPEEKKPQIIEII